MKLETRAHLRLRLRVRVSDGLNLGGCSESEESGGCVATEEKEDLAPPILSLPYDDDVAHW